MLIKEVLVYNSPNSNKGFTLASKVIKQKESTKTILANPDITITTTPSPTIDSNPIDHLVNQRRQSILKDVQTKYNQIMKETLSADIQKLVRDAVSNLHPTNNIVNMADLDIKVSHIETLLAEKQEETMAMVSNLMGEFMTITKTSASKIDKLQEEITSVTTHQKSLQPFSQDAIKGYLDTLHHEWSTLLNRKIEDQTTINELLEAKHRHAYNVLQQLRLQNKTNDRLIRKSIANQRDLITKIDHETAMAALQQNFQENLVSLQRNTQKQLDTLAEQNSHSIHQLENITKSHFDFNNQLTSVQLKIKELPTTIKSVAAQIQSQFQQLTTGQHELRNDVENFNQNTTEILLQTKTITSTIKQQAHKELTQGKEQLSAFIKQAQDFISRFVNTKKIEINHETENIQKVRKRLQVISYEAESYESHLENLLKEQQQEIETLKHMVIKLKKHVLSSHSAL